jgi:hypothetical protein
MEPEEVTPDCPPAMVEDVLKTLEKAIKAHQLYLHNNPSYLKSLATTKAAIEPLWALTGSLVLQVTDTQLKYFGVPVNDHPDKGGDSLPWLLFKDGLRELTLLPGFEDGELDRFLAIIPKVRHAQPHEDDLLTLLWEQDFECLKYRYVEINDPAAPFAADSDPGRWPASDHRVYDDPSAAVEEAKEEAQQRAEESASSEPDKMAGLINMDEFDASLYFLDPNEIEYLRQETEREYSADLRRLVLCALLDIFELQVDPLVRDEFIRGLLELTEQEGWTVFVSSHDIEEVQRLADRIAIINRGQLALDETSDSLQSRFRAIEAVLPDDAKLPANLPTDWLHAEQAVRTLRFTASRFQSDAQLAAALRKAIPTASTPEIRPMSLREIFVALARAYRLEGK